MKECALVNIVLSLKLTMGKVIVLDFKRLSQFYIHQVFLMCVCMMAVYDFFLN